MQPNILHIIKWEPIGQTILCCCQDYVPLFLKYRNYLKKKFALKKNTLTISFLFKEKEVIKLNIISPKSSIGKVCSLGL